MAAVAAFAMAAFTMAASMAAAVATAASVATAAAVTERQGLAFTAHEGNANQRQEQHDTERNKTIHSNSSTNAKHETVWKRFPLPSDFPPPSRRLWVDRGACAFLAPIIREARLPHGIMRRLHKMYRSWKM